MGTDAERTERLLDRLAPGDRAELERVATERRYAAGADLFHEGDPVGWVVGILEGTVKVTTHAPDGREDVLAICAPGEVLGELAAIDGGSRSATATAVEPVRALLVAADDFRGFLASSQSATTTLLVTLAGRIRDAGRRDLEYTSLDSVRRVAARLTEMAERFGAERDEGAIEVKLAITREELAGWAGCSLEATGKALSKLRNLGWIETGRRQVTILDLDSLRDRATG